MENIHQWQWLESRNTEHLMIQYDERTKRVASTCEAQIHICINIHDVQTSGSGVLALSQRTFNKV